MEGESEGGREERESMCGETKNFHYWKRGFQKSYETKYYVYLPLQNI